MIGLVATLEIRDGKQGEFEAVFKDLSAQVKANEPGCIWYQLFKLKDSATTYKVLEQYSSPEALEAHGKSAHMADAQPKLAGVLADAPHLEFLDLVE